MKKMKLSAAFAVLLSLIFAGCSNSSSDNISGSSSLRISLNLTAAKAYASAATTNALSDTANLNAGLTRGADTSNSGVYKITDTGKVEDAFSLAANNAVVHLNEVNSVIQNPVNNDFYIILGEGFSYILGEKRYPLGPLLVVHKDGSVKNVFDVSAESYSVVNPSTKEPMIAFDSSGNLYCLECDNNRSTSVFYKYDSTNDSITQLTAEVRGITYKKFKVSKDGKWLFAQGIYSNIGASSSFIRAIPVSDPNNPKNLVYVSSASVEYYSWIYDETSDAVYVFDNRELCKYTKDSNNEYSQDTKTIIYNNSDAQSLHINDYIAQISSFISNSSGIWASCHINHDSSTYYLVKLFDSSRNFIETFSKVEGISSSSELSVVAGENNLYCKNSITSGGTETGQNIMEISGSDGSTKNIFANLPNSTSIKITSFTSGSNVLYFSGSDSSETVNGKINLETLEYEKVNSETKLSSIIVAK